MVQIYNEPSLGKILGSGIAQSLNALAENKMRQVQKRNQQKQTSQGLSQIPGFTPEMAEALSGLDPQVLSKLLPEIQRNQREQEFAKSFQVQQGQQVPGQEQQHGFVPEGFPAPRNSKEALEIAKMTHKERLNEKKSERELKISERDLAQKETLPFYEETLAKSKVAKDSEKRLNRMEELVKKGGLPVSGFYNLFKGLEEHTGSLATSGGTIGALAGGPVGAAVGGIIGAAVSPVASLLRSIQKGINRNQEDFEKLSSDFIKDAKAIFGSRITDQDLKAFMQTVPTLANTDYGKIQIIKNLKNFNKANEIKAHNMKKIIAENGGYRPLNLQEQVEERSKNQLDKLSKQFESGQEEIPEELLEKIARRTLLPEQYRSLNLKPS